MTEVLFNQYKEYLAKKGDVFVRSNFVVSENFPPFVNATKLYPNCIIDSQKFYQFGQKATSLIDGDYFIFYLNSEYALFGIPGILSSKLGNDKTLKKLVEYDWYDPKKKRK